MKRAAGLALAVGVHILLLSIVLRDRALRPPPPPLQRSDVVWARIKPPPAPATPSRLSKPMAAARPLTRAVPEENIAAPAAPAESQAGDNPAPLDSAELVRLAGAIGKELSAGEKTVVSPNSLQRKLERGLAAARDAVKPGFFEAARIELFSAPNDPKRIYKIITATGEYCVFYPDKNGMQGNDGTAYFGQPKISSCPIRF